MSGYIDNLPTPNQTLPQTQPLINRNFTVLDTAFTVDHTALTSLTNQGEHKQVTLIAGSSPSATPDGPRLYANVGPTKNELYFIQDSGDGGKTYQLTYGVPGTGTRNSSSFLPGQYLIAWGQTGAVGNNASITVSAFTTLYNVTFTINDSSASPTSRVYLSGISGNAFTIKVPTGGTVVLNFMAIGN